MMCAPPCPTPKKKETQDAITKRDSYSKEDWLIIESTDHGGSHFGRGKVFLIIVRILTSILNYYIFRD
jgi:hypothetical protein